MVDRDGPDTAAGSAVPEELVQRVAEARGELEQAVADLRAVMSDEEARDEFGIDVDRLLD